MTKYASWVSSPLLADFSSILLDPWVHPFWAVLSQLLIIAPQIGMVVVELGQEIVQFCRIFCLHGTDHTGLQKLGERICFS
jgi:hypothetical protein